MLNYLIRRLLQSIFVLLGVSIVVFILVQLSGDPVLQMLAGTAATEEDLQALRTELGYNDPLIVQYGRYLLSALQGDLGESLRFKRPALELVLDRLPATALLAVTSLFFALIVAVPVGILSAVRRNTWIDNFGMILALLGQSIPLFWLGIMFVLVFSVELRWLPPSGAGSWRHLILPAVTLGAYPMARIARLMRSSLLDVLQEEYMTTARAKGLRERSVVVTHGVRNAALPVITIVGLMFGTLMGGAVITETIFAWPGIGLLTIQAIQNRDFTLVQASVLVVSVIFIFVNLITDITYVYFDPRIRYE
ncbi:MAG: ABC transporter permease [Caldilineaceae bacterium]|nr:ABC transporter permease [Caldilineaceae bacterium]